MPGIGIRLLKDDGMRAVVHMKPESGIDTGAHSFDQRTVIFCPTQQWWSPVNTSTEAAEVVRWIHKDHTHLCSLVLQGAEVVFVIPGRDSNLTSSQ